MANYGNITQAGTKGKAGGYKPKAYISLVSDIETFARPIAVPVAMGDKVKIVTAHTWVEGKAAIELETKLHSVTLTAAAQGDPGSIEFLHTAEMVFLGDDPVLFETIVQMLNDQKVLWLKDADCLENDSYVQLGDDCMPVDVTGSFASGNTREGQKTWTIQVSSKKKFFYLAALDIAA